MADWKKLSELELETIAGGVDEAASEVVALSEDAASDVVALTGSIL